jgi:hypothetical protein
VDRAGNRFLEKSKGLGAIFLAFRKKENMMATDGEMSGLEDLS